MIPRPPFVRATRTLTRRAADWLLLIFWCTITLAVTWLVAVFLAIVFDDPSAR